MKTIFITLSIFLGSILVAQETTKTEADGSYFTYNEIEGVVHFEKFTSDNQLVEVGAYLDGRPHGDWTRYDETGKIAAKAFYNFGSKEGRWLIWVTDEGILYEINYANNEKISSYKWRIEDQQYVSK